MAVNPKELLNTVVQFLEGVERTKDETISHLLSLGIEGLSENYIDAILTNYAYLLFHYGHTSETTFEAMNEWTSIRSHEQILVAINVIFLKETEKARNLEAMATLNDQKANLTASKDLLSVDEERILLKLENTEYEDDDVVAGLELFLATIQEELSGINVKLSDIEFRIERLNSGN